MQKLLLSAVALSVLGLVFYQLDTFNNAVPDDVVAISAGAVDTSSTSPSITAGDTVKQLSVDAAASQRIETQKSLAGVKDGIYLQPAPFNSNLPPHRRHSAESRQTNDLLRLLIAQTTPFSEDEVAQLNDPVAFMDKVNGILTGNVYESQYLQNPGAYQTMDFVGGDLSTMAFRHDNGRVFARLYMQDYTGDEVLVKWYNPQTGQVLAFDKYPVVPENSMHPLWLEHKQPWQSGQYNVEVYSADESLRLLSAAVYHVSGG